MQLLETNTYSSLGERRAPSRDQNYFHTSQAWTVNKHSVCNNRTYTLVTHSDACRQAGSMMQKYLADDKST
jgi:hypothetical protein